VRKLLTLTLASSAVVAIACSEKSPAASMSDDLKRDLKLASTTQDIRINPDEIAPSAKPQPAPKPKKAANGPKIVRSPKPTVLASAAPVEAAPIEVDVPDVQVTTPAPAETESAPEAPPLARPSTIPVSNNGSQGARAGHGDGGSTAGSVIGAIFGAVIRGGVVGDDDHCDPRSMPGARRPATDIYRGGIAGAGGMRGVPTSLPGRRRF